MNGRKLLVVLMTLWVVSLCAPVAHGQARIAALRDRLEKDLRARLPRDFAVIDMVVNRVNAGVLSQALVDKAYYRTRRRVPTYKNRVIYFEQTLRVLARDARTPLPPLPADLNMAAQTRTIPADQQPGFVATFIESLQRTLRRINPF